MILADKIMNERKRNGWSQEELAEKLGVSRQSVSKWESAQSVPDLNRILQLADIFGVTTDYLLKEELDDMSEQTIIKEEVEIKEDVYHVSMEEASEFIDLQKKDAPKIANAVSMCIASPILLIVLAGLSESEMFGISEKLAAGIGVGTLLGMIAAAVFIFIKCGARVEKFNFLEKKAIETALKYMTCYSYNIDQGDKTYYCDNADMIISCMAELASETTKIKGQTVKYCDVIDRLNEINQDGRGLES